VWNRQRKDEVLIDVHDVALGHMTKMRWNEQGKWIYSDGPAHPPIIDDGTFAKAQEMLTARRGGPPGHKPHRSSHDYVLRGLLYCGVCGRGMQGHWANAAAYYRCRFPAEYALANRVDHPLNVTLRQDAVLGPLDAWLAGKFEPRHLPATIGELAAAAAIPERGQPAAGDGTEGRIAGCDRRLAAYRAALGAGADPASVAQWITETEAEKARLRTISRPATPRPAMTREEIESSVNALAGLLAVIRDAGPPGKAEICTRLGLKLTYQPASSSGPR